jgi:hypothetical protein
MRRKVLIQADYSCESIDSNQFSEHFAEVHLSWLDANGERKRYGRLDGSSDDFLTTLHRRRGRKR